MQGVKVGGRPPDDNDGPLDAEYLDNGGDDVAD